MNQPPSLTKQTTPGLSAGKLALVFSVPVIGLCLLAWVDQNDAWSLIGRQTLDKVILGGTILWIALGVYHLICTLLIDRVLARSRARPLPKLLRHLATMLIAMLAGLLVAYSLAPAAFSGILALSGVLGVVLGLALKPLILDVFSGISTNLDSAFQIGDWVEIGSRSDGRPNSGWIEEINWRTTHIRTRNGNIVIFPNSLVGTSVISNYSRPWPLSRVDTLIRLPSEVEVSRCLRVLKAAVDATVGMDGGSSKEQPGDVILAAVKDGMAIYEMRCWIDCAKQSSSGISHLLLVSALSHLRIAGIPLAEPAVMNLESRVILDNTSERDIPILLAQIELFHGMEEEDLNDLASALSAKNFSRGEVLVEQGDGGTDMFVILEGAVEVLVRTDGGEVIVAQMQAGDYFGEMAMLTGEARTATVRATTQVKIWQIPREGIARVLDGNAPMMELVSRNLAERNLNRSARLEQAQPGTPEEQKRSLSAALLAKMKQVFCTSH